MKVQRNVKEKGHLYGEFIGLKVTNKNALITNLRAGIDYDSLEKIQSFLGISPIEIGNLVQIAPRTLTRRKSEGRLHPAESERLYRFGALIEKACEVLEDKETAIRWLNTPKKALNNETPLHYAVTEVGNNEVIELLGRIEHGVFS